MDIGEWEFLAAVNRASRDALAEIGLASILFRDTVDIVYNLYASSQCRTCWGSRKLGSCTRSMSLFTFRVRARELPLYRYFLLFLTL